MQRALADGGVLLRVGDEAGDYEPFLLLLRGVAAVSALYLEGMLPHPPVAVYCQFAYRGQRPVPRQTAFKIIFGAVEEDDFFYH